MRLTGPLLLAPLIALGGLFADHMLKAFERYAAADISAALTGAHKRVMVTAEPNGLVGGAAGQLTLARIEASGFETPRLPFFVQPELSRRGRIGQLELLLRDFKLSGLQVRLLQARLPGCRYDFGLALRSRKVRLSKSGTGRAYIEIEQEAIARFALQKYRSIEELSIQLRSDKVLIDGVGTVLFARSPFFVVADLVASGSKIELARARVLVGGEWLDDATVRSVIRGLNPVLDLDRDLGLYGALNVDRMLLRDGVLRAWGSVRIPDMPESVRAALQSERGPLSGRQ